MRTGCMYVKITHRVKCGFGTTFLATTLRVKLGSSTALTSCAVGLMTDVAASGRSNEDEIGHKEY
jgi:hypothetical protein